MSYQDENLSFLSEITVEKIDELCRNDKLDIATQEFIIKLINYFSYFLQRFCELPPIDESALDKFINTVLFKFIKLILPFQDVDIYTQSLLNIGSICYFFIKKKKELCFFPILKDLISQYKSFIPKDHSKFNKIELFLQHYKENSVLFYAPKNSNTDQITKEEVSQEVSVQIRPNKKIYAINSTFTNALYMSGIFIEIRKYISDISFFDDNQSSNDCFAKSQFILSFFDACFPFMSNEYINYFTSDLKNCFQNLDINFSLSTSIFSNKFNCRNALNFSRTLRIIADLSDENSNFFNELYFTTINNLIKSNDEEIYNSAISELKNIPHLPFHTNSFIQILKNSFLNDLIYSIKERDNQVIIMISDILNSKEMLPPSNELFEKCSGNNLFYSCFFPYIQNFFNDSSIDELFDHENHNEQNIQNVSVCESTGKLIVRLLDSEKYNKSTKLNLIFRSLFNLLLNKQLTDDFFIQFSKKEDFKEAIFQALSSIMTDNSGIDSSQFDLFLICNILTNLNSTLNFSDKSKHNQFPFELISQRLVYELDSILIPQYFSKYNFLPISDVELFWDLSAHSPLFYKLIQPNCDEIKEILISSNEFSIGLSFCLFTIFEKRKDIKYLIKAAIIAYSLNDSLATCPTTNEPDSDDIKDDFLLKLIQKIKSSFNNLLKDANFFEYLINIIENSDDNYIDQFTQFLSEVEFTTNIDQKADFSKIFTANDLSMLDSFSDDKAAILITLLMITNNDKIDEYVNNSVIEKLFDSYSVFAKTVISKFISTKKTKNYSIDIDEQIQAAFFESSQLGNYGICKSLINLANITLDNDFIYYSVPEIIEMIFKVKIPIQDTIWNFLSLLQSCQTYQQYETSFLCLLDREPQSEDLSPVLFNIIISEQLPSCLRNDNIIHNLMKRIAENPIKFLNYISSMNRIEHTEFHPQTDNLFLHVLAQFNDFIFDLINYKFNSNIAEQKEQQLYCQQLAYLLANLRFTSISKIPSKEFSISQLEDLYCYIPYSLLKHFRITYVKNNKMIESTFIPLNAEKSISYSLSKIMVKNIIINYPKVLFIQIDQLSDKTSEINIDDILDISNYSTKDIRFIYKLSSVVSEKNNVYIYDPNHLNNKLKKEPGYICYTPNKSYFTNNILEPIKFVVYQQESQNDDFCLWNSLISNSKSQKIKISGNRYLTSVVYDMGCTFMEVLNNPHIDWRSFQKNCPNFIDIAISLIQRLHIRPLFDTFCDDTEFSEYLFTKRFNILYDPAFTGTFSNEIIRASNVFPNRGLLICILCDDVMNFNTNIYFKILDNVTFDIDCQIYAISQMSSMYKEFYFTLYFKKFIKSPELTKEKLQDLLDSNKELLTSIFFISDLSLIDLLGESVSVDILREGVEYAQPSFLSEVLKRSPDDSELPEKIRLLSQKLCNNSQYQSLVLQKIQDQKENEKLLTINSITNLLHSTNLDFINVIIKQMFAQYPPETAMKYHIPETIVNLLSITKRFEDYYPIVDFYRKSFFGNQEITSLFVNFLFSQRPSSIKDYDKMADLTLRLPQIHIAQFIEAMKINLPMNQRRIYQVMVNYSSSDVEKIYELFFKICGKCRFLKLFYRYRIQFDILLQACYSLLANKDDLIKLFEPLIFENMDTSYIVFLLSFMQPYPKLFAFYYEKLISYKCVKETYAFTFFAHYVNKLVMAYYDRNVFYTSDDHVDCLITDILRITNDFIETNIMRTDWNPRVEQTVNYTDCILSFTVSLDTIKILQHDSRLELFRFWRNIAFTIPDFILNLTSVILCVPINLYNFLQDETERLALSILTCELYRECMGDRQIVPYENSTGYHIANSFLNSQFLSILSCKYLSYQIIEPYLHLLKGLLMLNSFNPLKQLIVATLYENVFIYNLFTKLTISNKILTLEDDGNGGTVVTNNEFIGLKDFFLLLIDSTQIPTNPGFTIIDPSKIVFAIRTLKKEDEMFNYRVLLFYFTIQKLPEKNRKDIVHQTYDFICDLASESDDENNAIHHLLDLYLENCEVYEDE